MSMLGKLIDGLRERRAGQEQAASTSYGQLVLRLVHDRPAKADTPEVVDELLRQAGLTPDDLAADVERAQAHYQIRQRCRGLAPALRASHDADTRWLAAVRHAQVEAERLQREASARHREAIAAQGQAQDLETALARVLELAPADLAATYRTARSTWRDALEALAAAREQPETALALERAAGEAQAQAERALAAMLAFDPDPAALRPAARPATDLQVDLPRLAGGTVTLLDQPTPAPAVAGGLL